MITETITNSWNTGTSYVPYVAKTVVCDWFCQSDKLHPIITLIATFVAVGTYALMGYNYLTRKLSSKKQNSESENHA